MSLDIVTCVSFLNVVYPGLDKRSRILIVISFNMCLLKFTKSSVRGRIWTLWSFLLLKVFNAHDDTVFVLSLFTKERNVSAASLSASFWHLTAQTLLTFPILIHKCASQTASEGVLKARFPSSVCRTPQSSSFPFMTMSKASPERKLDRLSILVPICISFKSNLPNSPIFWEMSCALPFPNIFRSKLPKRSISMSFLTTL